VAPHIEMVTHPERFAEIRSAWNTLWQRCDGDVFQSHAWIEAWWHASHASVKPRIAVCRDGDDILAAIPLAVSRRFGLRTLEWSAQALSDYCDALAAPQAVHQLPPLWEAVWRAGGFDLVNLTQVRPGAAARRALDRDPGSGGSGARIALRDRQERCLGIDCVWPDSEAWFRSLGKKGRNNFWRGERILEGLGGEVGFHCLDPAERSIRSELQYAMALKQDWLRSTDPTSPLLSRDRGVLQAMLDAAAGTGLMRLFLLTCGDRIAAASVNFVYADRMQAYVTAYDPDFNRASPGMILIVRYTRWAFDRGLRRVDFLRGDEPFKARLGNFETRLSSYIGARTIPGRAVLAALSRSRLRGQGSRERSRNVSGSAVPGDTGLADGN
jgi:CelD/BcsL family acetyltransferase involved in cellulose biosynthesis